MGYRLLNSLRINFVNVVCGHLPKLTGSFQKTLKTLTEGGAMIAVLFTEPLEYGTSAPGGPITGPAL